MREVTSIINHKEITKCTKYFYFGNHLLGKQAFKDISSFTLTNLVKPTKEWATQATLQWIYSNL